jgi:hypothetical protein
MTAAVVPLLRSHAVDVVDPGAVVHIVTRTSDGNDVVGGTHLGSRVKSYGNTAAARAASERRITDSCVAGAVEVCLER